jgi:ribonuclease P protein component
MTKRPICRQNTLLHTTLHRCGKTAFGRSPRCLSARLLHPVEGVDNPVRNDASILISRRASSPAFHSFEGNETDLSAKRAQAEAEARLPCADGDACRPPDSQASPHEGPQAPFGVAVQKKNRLSRSRDFDAVYRSGRSTSTRFLTLHWFERSADDAAPEPRLGLAVPKAAGNAVVRNRIKRQLREIWRAKLDGGSLSQTKDYVLVVRPGLPEAVEAQGHDWLVERVDEVLGKAAA